MRNYSGSTKKQVMGQPIDTYYWSGLVDVVHGRGFDPDYDTWHQACQRNYERGRLQATNIQTAGLKVPTDVIYTNRLAFVTKYATVTIGDPYINTETTDPIEYHYVPEPQTY